MSQRSLTRPKFSSIVKKRERYESNKNGLSCFATNEMPTITLWVTQREAAAALRRSERSLQRLRNDGLLPVGRCWVRKVPKNPNSDVLYDLSACEYHLSAATIAAQLEQDALGHPALEAVA